MVDSGLDRPKASLELADVVRRFGPAYRAHYGPGMMPSQKKALADIAACCTAALGGRRYRCDDCHESFWRYHCCRNRACPKCHGPQTQQWLQRRQTELLPCDYFHAVVTVPAQLQAPFRRQQKLLYGLLMQVAAQAVQQLCAHKRHLGALPGLLAVLHTWNGQLGYHPHVHLLITGGGLTPDGQHWQPARGEFLVPVAALSRKVAALFREALQAKMPAALVGIPEVVWQRPWVTFCKHYGQGNEAVLHYLSRYVFRTALSSARLVDMDATHVTFRSKDRKANRWRTERLEGLAFLRRFLQHVLPRGFHRVRYYGLWHPSKRRQSSRAWLLLTLEALADPPAPPRLADLLKTWNEATAEPSVQEKPERTRAVPRCPHCGSSRTRLLEEWSRWGVPRVTGAR
ncbi:MAG TPA: transposase [Candidatus Methylomirabilis sp.]|nr:transposase [Candidatus Methylomirabilis sp.]